MTNNNRPNLIQVILAIFGVVLLLVWFTQTLDFEPLIGLIAVVEGFLLWVYRKYKHLQTFAILVAILVFLLGLLGLSWITDQQFWLYIAFAIFLAILQAGVAYTVYYYFTDVQNYRTALRIIKNTFQEWTESEDYNWRSLMKYADMLFINSLKDRLVSRQGDITPEEKAYILRCALQHGLGGNWGYWLSINSRNNIIFFALSDVIKVGHSRPMWRVASILHATPTTERERFFNNLPNKHRNSKEFQELIEAVSSEDIESYFRQIVEEEEEPSKLGKISDVVHEISKFSNDLRQYERERQRIVMEMSN